MRGPTPACWGGVGLWWVWWWVCSDAANNRVLSPFFVCALVMPTNRKIWPCVVFFVCVYFT